MTSVLIKWPEFAAMAGVHKKTLQNWQKGDPSSFPEVIEINARTKLFRRADVVRYLNEIEGVNV